MKLEPPCSVDELRRRMRRARAELAAHWQRLSPEQLTKVPGPQADWSVKDSIAHILWWENAMLELSAQALAGDDIVIDGTVEDANAQAYADNRERPLDAVLADWEAGLARIEDFLAGLSDKQINDTDICQFFGHPLRHFIAANTYRHYADHQEDLREFVRQCRPQDEAGA